MKKTTTSFITAWVFFSSCLAPGFLQAQFENTGRLTNTGVIDGYTAWINSATGSYSGQKDGRFIHTGADTKVFVNHGEYNTSSGHKDIFRGPSGQNRDVEIGGTKRPNFFDVDFDNGAGYVCSITNTEGISVSGVLNFRNGMTTTDRNRHQKGSIVFEPGAAYINAVTDEQHVDGYVSKKGNTAFTFPVGSGYKIRTLEMSAPANVNAHVSVAWIPGNPGSTVDPSDDSPFHSVLSNKGNIERVSEAGQWDLIYIVKPDNPITVTVSIPDLSSFSPANNLRLVGWDGTGWIDLSNNPTATSNTEGGSLTGIIPNSLTISALGIGSVVSGALPVALLSFQVSVKEKFVAELKWATAGEVNNEYFDIEHSISGFHFEKVGKADGKGTYSASSDYTFVHPPDMPFGIHYYRIKQVDFDGTFAYSPVKSVRFDETESMAYPNPSREKITVRIANWKNLESIVLSDVSGREILRSVEKSPVLEISTVHLAPAIYILRFNYPGGNVRTQKIVIDR